MLRQVDARHAAALDASVERLAARLSEHDTLLRREAALLAQDGAVVDAARTGDWAALARRSARLRALTLERLADLVVVLDGRGALLAQVPSAPRITLPPLTTPTAPLVTLVALDGRPFLLGLAAIGGDAGSGLVVVGRSAERLDPTRPGGAALLILDGDRLRHATLAGAPETGWEAAAAAGERALGGESWRLRRIGQLGADAVWAAVADGPARAERRHIAEALAAGFALAAVALAGGTLLATRRRTSIVTAAPAGPPATAAERRSRELEAFYAAAVAMGSSTDLETTVTRSLEVICSVAQIDVGMVYRMDRATGRLTLVAHHGIAAQDVEIFRSSAMEDTRIGQAARTGEYTLVDVEPARLKDPTLRATATRAGYSTQLALPIPVAGATWGVFVAVTCERRRFEREELTLMQAVAHQVGLAVTRASLFAETRMKSRRLETLTRVTQRVTATLALDELLERVVEAAREMFDAPIARLWLLDEDGETLSLRAGAGPDAVAGLRRIRIGEGLVGRIAAERAPLAIADVLSDTRPLNTERLRAEGLVAFAGVPLLVGERVVGALAIGLNERHEYSAEELGVFASLGNQAAIAIENARLLESEGTRRQHLAALLDINTKIGTVVSTEPLLSSIAEEAARLLDVDNAGFRLRQGDELVLAGLAGTARETMKRQRIKLDESMSGRVFTTGRTLVLDDITAFDGLIPEHLAADRVFGYTTFLGVPLRVGDRAIGVLTFRARRRFTARDVELAEAFAGQAAIAIEHARLVGEASRQADRMAGLADLSRVFTGTLDPDVVSERIVDCVRRLFSSLSAALFRVDPDTGDLIPAAMSTERPRAAPAVVVPRSVGISGLAAASGRIVASADVLNDPHIRMTDDLRRWIEAVGHLAAMAVPLVVNETVIGVLTVGEARGHVFDADAARLGQAFADQAALALANARLYAEATRRRTEAEELARLARSLTETLDVAAVVERMADSVLPLFHAQSSVVRLLEPDGSLVALALGGRAREAFEIGHVVPPGVGVLGRAVSEGHAVSSTDLLRDPLMRLSPDLRADLESAGDGAALAVPMRAKGVIIGALGIVDRRGRVFTDDEAALLQAFADQATLALENARLFSVERARRQQIAALADVERELAAVLDTDRLLTLVVERSTALFNASGALWRLDDDGGLVPRAWSAQDLAQERLAPGEGLAGLCVLERRGLLTNDYATSPHATGRFVQAGVRSVMVQPLVVRDRPLGVLTMSRSGADAPPFAAEDLAVLQSFAAHAATAIENARLYEEARRYADRLRALEEVNRLVSSSLNPDEVLANLARAIAQFFEAPYVSVWGVEETTGRLRRAIAHGDAQLAAELREELAPGEGAVGWVVQHREPIVWTDLGTDPRFVGAPSFLSRGLAWLTAYPIVIGERVLGAFAVHRTAPSAVTPETASLMGSLAAQAAVALENARLYAATSRRLTETRALLEVAEILNSTLDARQRLKRVAMKAAQVCAVDRCSIELWDGDRLRPLMSQYADGRRVPGQWQHFQQEASVPVRQVPINTRVLETRRPVIVDDVTADDLMPREWVEFFGMKGYMVVPMLRQDEVIGVVTLDYCDRPQRFLPWQVDLATAVVGQLALSLDNSRLFAEAQERLRETTTLLAIGRVLSQPDSGRDLMRLVSAEVARAFGADMVGAYLLDETKERLVAAAGYHVPKDLLPFFAQRPLVLEAFPLLRDAWISGRASWSSDPLHDERFDRDWQSALPPHSVLFTPTLAHGEPVGGLFLVWWHPGRVFEPAEVRLLEGVAAQVGLAMENSELARQTQVKLAETETLLSVSRALSSTLDFQGLVRHFLRAVATTVGADCVGSWLVQEDGEWLEPLAGYRVPPERLADFRQFRVSLLKHAFYAEAARTKRPVYTTDAMNDSRLPAQIREHGGHRSQLFVPVIVKDRLVAGFAAVWWERERRFSEGELALMEAIANQAGVAFENARLFEENRRRLEELSVLHDLSRAVTGQLDRAALIEALRQHVGRVLDARHMVLILRDDDRGEMEIALRVAAGVVDMRAPLRYGLEGVGLMSVVMDGGRPVRTDDYAAECDRHGIAPVPASAELRHWLGVPLIGSRGVLGMIALRGGDRPFTAADEQLLTNIAHLGALAVSSARLFEERTRAYGELAAAQDQLVRTEKLRALGEMASGVAHDFNNLLASVLGRAQLLLRRVQEPQLRQWLQVIERSALDGAQTVRRLQEFTRIRRDQPMVPLDVTQAVREALEITQSRWREEPMSRGIVIDVRTALQPVPPILGDAAELREALTNLILNAVDAMPDGGTLALSTVALEDQVEVHVADTGLGIPPEVRDKIFDPFFTTKGPRGTGLGLSMTYGIVSRHGGFITVDSDEGRGSTFRLSFPSAAAVTAPPPPLLSPASPAPPVRPLHCLVVDDEEAVRTVLADIIESAGHRVTVVSGGADAIARFRAEPYDVVLTDLAMPRVSGWQVARAVKALAPRVPVFLVTGFGVELSPEERRAHGVDLVLVKPLQIQDILDALADVARSGSPPARPEDTPWPTST
ncbi:MAG TPA: GAF domain-containing protein [Methylomirabilota bacterium]|nr:GAF domain-containing protein [Methylomirabilota bacterium]